MEEGMSKKISVAPIVGPCHICAAVATATGNVFCNHNTNNQGVGLTWLTVNDLSVWQIHTPISRGQHEFQLLMLGKMKINVTMPLPEATNTEPHEETHD